MKSLVSRLTPAQRQIELGLGPGSCQHSSALLEDYWMSVNGKKIPPVSKKQEWRGNYSGMILNFMSLITAAETTSLPLLLLPTPTHSHPHTHTHTLTLTLTHSHIQTVE